MVNPETRMRTIPLEWAVVLLSLAGWTASCGSEATPPGPSSDADTGVTSSDAGVERDTGGMVDGGGVTDTSSGDVAYDSGMRADTASPVDTTDDAGEFPNACGPKYREMINASGPSPRVRRIPWKMIAGGSPTYRKKTVSAIWKGTRKLKSPVSFNCPPTAAKTGLVCKTSRGLVLQHTASGSARTLLFAISIPLQSIDFPQKGAPVRLTYHAADRYGEFEMRRKDGTRIVVLRAAGSDDAQGRGRSNPETFLNDYGDFEIAMRAPIDDAGSAYCIASDHCGRLLRVEPLTLVASKVLRVDPGSNRKFGAKGTDYRFWHMVSIRRNQELGPDSSCKDITYPAASYAFARVK